MSAFSRWLMCVAGGMFVAGTLFAQEEPSGWLGIFMRNINESIAARQGLKTAKGVLVEDVIKGSPAEKGGLLRDDVILHMDGKVIGDTAQLKKMILQRADKAVQMGIARAGQQFSLPVTIGRAAADQKWLSVAAFNEESAGDSADKTGSSRQALDSYLKVLNERRSDSVDLRLREKIIAVVRRLEVQPAIPEEAERAMVVARAAQAEAQDESGYDKAIRNYAKASCLAPWVPEIYFNLGAICDRRGLLHDALRNFRLYLLAAPGAEDAQKVRDKIFILEDKLKEIGAAKAETAKQQQAVNDRRKKAKEMQNVTIAVGYGMNNQETGRLIWGRRPTHSSRIFSGITWEPGMHIGIEVNPAYMRFNPKGSSFVVGCGTIGLIYENSHSSPGVATVADYDSLTHVTSPDSSLYLTEESFALAKFVLSDEITMGCRIQLNKMIAVEPYGGMALAFHMIFLGGTEVNDKTMTNDFGFRIGFPLGARVYYSRLFVEYEFQNVTKWWGIDKLTYYDKDTERIEYTASIAMDDASYWAVKAGITF
ncbi:MAG: PDZ domain-containing protein [Chitinispirillaceae bacterium]|nr:PDZ domain-containing protein [Chitinispirillaceae bacterium]